MGKTHEIILPFLQQEEEIRYLTGCYNSLLENEVGNFCENGERIGTRPCASQFLSLVKNAAEKMQYGCDIDENLTLLSEIIDEALLQGVLGIPAQPFFTPRIKKNLPPPPFSRLTASSESLVCLETDGYYDVFHCAGNTCCWEYMPINFNIFFQQDTLHKIMETVCQRLGTAVDTFCSEVSIFSNFDLPGFSGWEPPLSCVEKRLHPNQGMIFDLTWENLSVYIPQGDKYLVRKMPFLGLSAWLEPKLPNFTAKTIKEVCLTSIDRAELGSGVTLSVETLRKLLEEHLAFFFHIFPDSSIDIHYSGWLNSRLYRRIIDKSRLRLHDREDNILSIWAVALQL